MTSPLLTKEGMGEVSRKRVASRWSYYFLSGHEDIVEMRRRSIVPTDLKLAKAQRVMKYVSWLPFLRAIFISSSVATETAHAESDIDFFVVTAPGRIWLVRLALNVILRLFGLRIYGKKRKDRACLCFFVDTDHLDLSPWRIAPDDIHFIYWLHQMIPLYDPENKYEKFLMANQWTGQYVPYIRNEYFSSNLLRKVKKNRFKKITEKIVLQRLGDFLEQLAQKIQWLKLPSSLKEKSVREDKEVVIAPGVLKFHDHDTRREIKERWLRQVEDFFKEK